MNLLSSTALALSFLIGSTIKAKLLLVLAAGVAHALRGQSAAGRHHVWSLGIAGLLVLPFLTLLLPTWHSRTLGNAARFLAPAHAGAQSTGFQDLPSMVINAATASPLSVQFSQLVLLIWLVGVLLVVVKLAGGLTRLAWISARSTPVNSRLSGATCSRRTMVSAVT